MSAIPRATSSTPHYSRPQAIVRPAFAWCSVLLMSLSVVTEAQTLDSATTYGRSPVPAKKALLLKLATGFTRPYPTAYRVGTVPLVAGLEYARPTGWSLYVNGVSGFGVSVWQPNLVQLAVGGFEAGVRHYYNQPRRQQRSRRTGAGIGNYWALQTASLWQEGNTYRAAYEYTAGTAQWGLQRRLGGHGIFDASLGLGIYNPERTSGFRSEIRTRKLEVLPEVGVKLGLVW
ncbi:hypothetical protein [Hymenobacter volaticus]|uniref:DUF3575 domain-containing protein n=1 Tax=Hymenobacter volaticus TaxID=2932254 RepID=A0ABY4GET2_9BACT|nr:hypothetical protein [Hymenobacter volaticus]UOQ69404.1 hypothetical protein MUN86_27330 [Hymenobacter volaticus]